LSCRRCGCASARKTSLDTTAGGAITAANSSRLVAPAAVTVCIQLQAGCNASSYGTAQRPPVTALSVAVVQQTQLLT
jgi:hypothetical protein